MKYFKNTNNEIFAYDDEQVAQGYAKDLEEILTPIYDGKYLVGHKAIEVDENGVIVAPQSVVDYLADEAKAKAELDAKTSIAEQLANLTVTTSNGNTFDANDQARLNMSNAIISADVLGMTETTWRMADNSDVVIGLAELKEALALSIQEFARLKSIGV